MDPEYFKTGYTNSPEVLMHGEPSLSSMTIEGDENEFIVKLGNGTKRHYELCYTNEKKSIYRLI